MRTLEETFFDVLEKKLKERLDLKVEAVSTGCADDYAAYRELVGAVMELRYMLEEFKITVKAFSPD